MHNKIFKGFQKKADIINGNFFVLQLKKWTFTAARGTPPDGPQYFMKTNIENIALKF
jgi:hypothetical protein